VVSVLQTITRKFHFKQMPMIVVSLHAR